MLSNLSFCHAPSCDRQGQELNRQVVFISGRAGIVSEAWRLVLTPAPAVAPTLTLVGTATVEDQFAQQRVDIEV